MNEECCSKAGSRKKTNQQRETGSKNTRKNKKMEKIRKRRREYRKQLDETKLTIVEPRKKFSSI